MNIGERIRQLRIEKGFSQEDLANRANFSKSYIQKFEEGQREIKSSHLAQFSIAFGIGIPEIIRPVSGIANEFIIKNIEFREANKLQMDIDYFEKKMLGLLYSRYSAFVKLEKILGDTIEFIHPFKNFPVIAKEEDVEEIAEVLRKKWKFNNTPIYDLIAFLEDLGVKIFEAREENDFVGFSCWVRSTPIIVINITNTDVSRRRFTILHELAHLLLKFKENERKERIERFCDQFAGAMLLPEEALKSYISSNVSITLEELKRIKSKYGISIIAILVRMVHVNLITWEKFREWKEMYRSWNDKDSDYNGRENIGRFKYLLAKGLREGRIGKDLASELSGIPMSELNAALNQEFKF